MIVDGVLLAYHGTTPQRIDFTAILADVVNFLQSDEGRSETIIMSILEEGQFLGSSPLFSGLVRDTIFNAPSSKSLWWLEPRMPTLGEARGKIVMFSRFGGQTGEGWEDGVRGMGIHPTRWPDSAKDGFDFELEDTRVRVQDWYAPFYLSILTRSVTKSLAGTVSPHFSVSRKRQLFLLVSYSRFPHRRTREIWR